MPKIAFIMTGHERMVPYGYHALKNAMSTVDADYDIFSYTWNNQSESREVPLHPNLESTSAITDQLGSRNIQRHQPEYMEPIWINYPLKDTINYKIFSRFMGQILGFLLALDFWKTELQEYDYIVRSRWDVLIDHNTITSMLNSTSPNMLFTKGVSIYQGHSHISGDTIYGPRDIWFKTLLPVDRSISKIYSQSVARYSNSMIQQATIEAEQIQLSEFFLKNRWFSSHAIWGMLFQGENISVETAGEAYPIGEALLDIELTELTEFDIRTNGGRAL
jgi:hypothetical protein